MAGSKQIAMRTIEGSTNTLNWLLTDHLGSTSVSANEDGSWNSTIKYTAFGCPCAARRVLRKTRETSGVTPTKYRYTGQLLEAEVGLYYYVARWYDPAIMHFVQADKFIPNANSSKSYDRYTYGLNNPLIYNDPTGNDPWYIEGWDDIYKQEQDGNTCAVVSIAVSLSILLRYPYKQENIQRVFPHTNNFYWTIISHDPESSNPYKMEVNRENLAIGVVPDEQAIGINTMFPGTIKATSTKGTRDDLLNNLKNGKPTMITIALPINQGVGHVLVVIGYDESTEEFWFFNPASGKIEDEKTILDTYNCDRGYKSFDELWGSSNGVIESNSMVTVEKVSSRPFNKWGWFIPSDEFQVEDTIMRKFQQTIFLLFGIFSLVLTVGCIGFSSASYPEAIPDSDILFQIEHHGPYVLGIIQADATNFQALDIPNNFVRVTWSSSGEYPLWPLQSTRDATLC